MYNINLVRTMVKVRVRTYCKRCGKKEIVEAERDVDGALAGDIHCGQCGDITVGEIDEV
jgi:transcription elongation factor Elf1